MNILIVNDDGINCKGIHVLADRLSEKHNVYVLAPDKDCSAVSHHISIFKNKNTVLKKYENNQWGCSGYPADCTFIGLESNFFKVKFDVVLSGINRGANLGTDIVYSGTCAGARQAVFNGVPGIALSIDIEDYSETKDEDVKYDAMADFVEKNLETLISFARITEPRMFVNVNGGSLDSYKGVKFGKSLSLRRYDDSFEILGQGDVLSSRFCPGKNLTICNNDSDLDVVRNGYICINQIYADPVANEVVDGITFKL